MLLIIIMEKSDYLLIDGRQLQILLTIQRAGSLSGAAKILDMNQSTVSYWLDQMRERTGDPLFVRSGNGVEPTERAKVLFPEAEAALRHVEAMFETPEYHPAEDESIFKFAATAVERCAFVEPFLRHVREKAPGLTIEIERPGSHYQTVQRLQQGTTDLAFMPLEASESENILRRKIVSFKDIAFFDEKYPLTEGDIDAYCERPHARVSLGPDTSFAIDRRLAKMGRKRKVVLQTADFDSALALIRGTDMIVTLPNLLAAPGLSTVNPPWETNTINLGMFWHARSQTSARNKYWRDAFVRFAKSNSKS